MNKIRLVLWLVIGWTVPALIAGALGWKGIWGSGSALTEFLIPLPVAGGVLHVPSFLLATALVYLLPDVSPAAASRLRALLFGLFLAGLLWLLNLDDIVLALKDSQPLPYRLWDANPLGLFVASDALLALFFTMATPQRPWLRLEGWTLLLIALPLALPLQMAMPRPSSDQPFEARMSRRGHSHGDEELMVFTRLDPAAADFRQRAEAWAGALASMAHPRYHVTAEDVALRFTRSREAAQHMDSSRAEATLCLYEDGTPSRWLPGSGDCFSGHKSFGERLSEAYAQRPPGEPQELRAYFAARHLCDEVKPPKFGDEQGVQLTATFRCGGLDDQRRTLQRKYPGTPGL